MNYDCVLEGGGTKIAGLIGAIFAIEQKGFIPKHMAGASAGAIVASLRMAGYTPEEMKNILLDLDFRTLLDPTPIGRRLDNFWLAKGLYSFVTRGMYKGDAFYEWIKEKLAAKGVRTFGDLSNPEAKSNRDRWAVKVVVSDLTYERMRLLPDDCFKSDPNELEVALAVRMSMSIPYLFHPVKWEGSQIVDGGLLSNFPLWVFDSNTTPRWPTFGVLLEEDNSYTTGEPRDIKGAIGFARALIETMTVAHDRKFIRPGDYEYRTIKVPVGSAKTTDFDMSAFQKDFLFHSGVRAGIEFLKDWDFEEYKRWASSIRGVR